jgi:hypothetical protein
MQEYPEEIDVNSWEEFEQQLKDLREHVNSPESAALSMLFRGQENSCWPLATTLERSNQLEMLFQDYYRLISSRLRKKSHGLWVVPLGTT